MRLHLYKRGMVWWLRGSEYGVKHRESAHTADKKAAELTRLRRERELADPTHHAANQATVASATDRFLGELKRSARCKETYTFYEQKAHHVVRLLGSVRLAELTHARVLGYIRTREAEGAAPYSIHRERTALRRVLKSAARAGEFSRDTKAIIPEYATGYVPRDRALTPIEFYAVMAHLPPDRAAVLAFDLATGAVRGERRRARCEDIGETSIRIRGTKRHTRNRTVPILGMFRPLVELVKILTEDRSGLLHEPWGNMRRDLHRVCRRAGVAPFSEQVLRHTAATWLVKRGVSLEHVAKWLGHASTAMVYKVYGHLVDSDIGRIIDERTGHNMGTAPAHHSGASERMT